MHGVLEKAGLTVDSKFKLTREQLDNMPVLGEITGRPFVFVSSSDPFNDSNFVVSANQNFLLLSARFLHDSNSKRGPMTVCHAIFVTLDAAHATMLSYRAASVMSLPNIETPASMSCTGLMSDLTLTTLHQLLIPQ